MTPAVEPSWLREARELAARDSRRLGLPDRSHEDWKHVAPSDLLPECADADEGGIVLAATESVLPEAWARLVFAGGRFRPELSLVPGSTPDWTVLPLSDAADSRSRDVAARLGSCEPADHAHRDEWYHEIRKAAKRLRYAGESVAPAFGEPALVLAARAEALQEALGEHQDSVVARAALRELGVRLHLDGDNAFTLGRLHALEQVRGEKALGEFAQDWTALAAPSTTAWLRG